MKIRKQRLIALDHETGSIHTVIHYEPDNTDPGRRCVMKQRLFYPRYGAHLPEIAKQQSVSYSYTHQLLDKVTLYLTNDTRSI